MHRVCGTIVLVFFVLLLLSACIVGIVLAVKYGGGSSHGSSAAAGGHGGGHGQRSGGGGGGSSAGSQVGGGSPAGGYGGGGGHGGGGGGGGHGPEPASSGSAASGGGEQQLNPNNPKKNPQGLKPATCSELAPAKGFSLKELTGAWILQEKLEFPDGTQHHTTVPNRDQTAICLRTVAMEVSEKETSLLTTVWKNKFPSKNYTGFIKVKDTGHWDFHMLSKDHDGMAVMAEPKTYFVFVECVKDVKSGSFDTPGSVFVYTRGNLPDKDMDKLRKSVDDMLRRDDETFLDFGAYCY